MSDEWEVVPLSDIVERVTTKNSYGVDKVYTVSAQMGLVDQETYFNKRVASKNLANYSVVECGDYVFNKSYSEGYPLGVVARNKGGETGLVSPLYIVMRAKSNRVLDGWLDLAFSSREYEESLQGLMKEGGRAHGALNVKLSDYFSALLPLPPLPVQRRIVDLMTHVDSHLANLRAERDALAITRKVMLTDALAGQLADAPMNDEWVETTLEQVCRVRSSKRVLQKDWQNSGVPFYRGREISSLAAQGFVAPDLHIEQSHFERLAASSGVPLRGDLLITAIGTIGNTYVIPNETPLYFKDASVLWVSPSSSIESWYLKYWFASAGFWNQVVSGNGTTVDTLTISALSKMTISIPPLPVQRRIVDLMTRVDEQIKNLSAEFQTLGESRTALLADLLSQGIEVPSTYDSLLPKVA